MADKKAFTVLVVATISEEIAAKNFKGANSIANKLVKDLNKKYPDMYWEVDAILPGSPGRSRVNAISGDDKRGLQ